MQLESERKTGSLHDLTGLMLGKRNKTECSYTIAQDSHVLEPTDGIVDNCIVFTVQGSDNTQVNYSTGDKLYGSILTW